MFQQGFFQIDPDATPDQIKRKREAIQRAMNRGPAQYAGEGLTHLAGGIASLFKNRRLDDFEQKKRKEAGETFNSIFGPYPEVLGQTYAAPSPEVETRPLTGDPVIDGAQASIDSANGFEDWNNRIRRVETGGEADPWAARGPVVQKGRYAGERAIGPNQIMPGNIPEWGAAAGIEPKFQNPDVLASGIASGDPAARAAYDAIVENQYNQMASKGLNPTQMANVWFTGSPNPDPNVSDGYTSAATYASRFNGGGGGSASRVAQNVGDVRNIVEAMSDPWIMQDQGKAAVLQMMLQNAMTPSQPGYRQVTGAQLGMTGEAAGQMFNVGPDGKISAIGGAATNINVNTGQEQPKIGNIPQGYSVVEDPTQPSGYRMVAIPGGPEDTSANDAATQSARDTASDNVLTAASRARSAATDRNGPNALTGIVGRINPYSDSAEVLRQVSVLRNITSAEQLNAMRRQSKTGGALGNVTERELTLLAEQGGALDPNSPNFLRDLADYERAILRTIHGKEAGDRIFEETRGGWTDLGNGIRVRPKQ